MNSSKAAVANPRNPPQKIIYPRGDLPSPMALFIPWMGKGECTSQNLNPASRTFSAASYRVDALENSAMTANAGLVSAAALMRGPPLRFLPRPRQERADDNEGQLPAKHL